VKWLVLAAFLLAGWAAFLMANRSRQSQASAASQVVPTVAVQAATVDRVIRLNGGTSAIRFTSLKMPRLRGGRSMLTLTHLTKGGVQVKKGDVIASIDSTRQLENLEEAGDVLDQAQANLRRRIAQRQVDVENLQQNLRSRKAAMDKAVQDYRVYEVKTAIDKELLKLQVDQTTAQYQQAEQSQAYQEVSIAADIAAFELFYKRLELRRDRIVEDLKHFTFVAPMDGLAVVLTLHRGGANPVQYQLGDAVTPGMEFVKIVDLSSMQLEAVVNQVEAREIKVGMPARVELDAFPAVKLSGSVYSITPMAVASRVGSMHVRTVSVKVRIDGVDPRLMPDMSGSATIPIARREEVLAVPLEALHSENGVQFVYVETAEGFAKQDIEIGLRSATSAEVVSGLTAGQRVALTKPSAVL
jgi:multidrug efflux pump subunit AcrA (membrane-fusion protein)